MARNGSEHEVRERGPAAMARPGRRGRGGTIIDITAAVIFFGLLALGVLWVIKMWGQAEQQYTTAMIDTKYKATDVACQMNLRTIAQNLQMYAISNERYPRSQQELVDFSGNSRLFRCPDPNGGEYIYVPGQRGDAAAAGVLVYESKPVHRGRCNVLFTNGEIVPLTPEELKQALAATSARRR
jgi:hypothetical protein